MVPLSKATICLLEIFYAVPHLGRTKGQDRENSFILPFYCTRFKSKHMRILAVWARVVLPWGSTVPSS